MVSGCSILLKFRIIARLDVRNEYLISRVRFEGVRKVGYPVEFAESYDAQAADEIFYLDAVASLYGRNSLSDLVRRGTECAFVPVAVGGGITSIDQARLLFDAGADKVAINTAAIYRPGILTDLARKFGSQAVVLQLDAKRRNGGWEAYCDGGRQPTGRDALEWATEAVDRGAGEILVTSIDHEGVRAGFALDLIGAVARLPVPVIASGGFGVPHHAVEAYETGVSGVAIAGALHYGKTTINEIREALRQAGIAVRA